MPDITLSTLEQIRTKVRRLTRSPSATQLLDSDIDIIKKLNNYEQTCFFICKNMKVKLLLKITKT